jgi:hypothetical protein
MGVKRTYAPGVSEIKSKLLSKLKENLRLTVSEFDESLKDYIDSAIEVAERETGCIFLPSEFVITATSSIDESGYYPADEVTSVKFDGVEVDIENVHITGGRLYVHTDEGTKIEVTFDAGYNIIPAPVQQAVLLIAGASFRTPVDSVESLPKASTNLLRHYRRWLR